MKYCPNCGAQNPDEAKFCTDCGTTFKNVQTEHQNNTKQSGNKNKWIAAILNFIGGAILYCLCGIGHIVYLRLYNRGLILGAMGLLISTAATLNTTFGGNLILNIIISLIGLGLIIYSIYDAVKCCYAINEGRDLPLLFGLINPEEMTQTKAIAIAAVCLVAFIVVFGIYMASPGEIETASPIITTDILNQGSESDIQVKITCPVEWSASIGGQNDSTSYDGTGDKTIDIDDKNYDVIAAAVQKRDSGSDMLKVEIIKDGKTLDSESTTEEYGVVTVSSIL